MTKPARKSKRRPKSTRERQLEAEVRVLLKTAREAEKESSWTAAVQARKAVASLRDQLQRLRDEAELATKNDELERLRYLRAMATRAGSWVAVQKLAAAEAEVDARRQLEAKQAEEEALEGIDDSELLDDFRADIAELPDVLVEQLHELVRERLHLDEEGAG